MKDYILTLKLKSPIINPITSDHLNGAFLYFLSIKKSDLFDHFYQGFVNDTPGYLFSSILPKNYLPINPDFLSERVFFEETKNNKDLKKSLKKINFLPKDFFSQLIEKKSLILNQVNKTNLVFKNRRYMVSIKNNNLFYENLFFYKDNLVDIYLRVFEDFEIDWLDEFFSYFVGKKISSGFANFSLVDVLEINLPQSSKYFLNLSAFVPKKEENQKYQSLNYSFFVKYPKLGIKIGRKNPFKKKIILVKEGSVFKLITDEKIDYFGKILTNLSAVNDKIIQITLTIPYYFDL